MKLFTADQIVNSDHFGWSKDGTSRNKQKILENTITLHNGVILPTWFHNVCRESAEDISDSVKRELKELSAILDEADINDGHIRHEILNKLSYFMTDRAANEKLSNRNLIIWDRSEVNNDSLPILFSLHCMAHVLLGFQKYAAEEMVEL